VIECSKVRISFAHLADYATTSRTGQLSIIGIFGAIYVKQVPAVHPRMVLAVGLVAGESDEGKDCRFEANLVTPDGKSLRKIVINVKLERYDPVDPKLNITIPFDMVPLNDLGPYQIEITLHGHEDRNIVFTVTKLPPQMNG
jgi:hypothetical protein